MNHELLDCICFRWISEENGFTAASAVKAEEMKYTWVHGKEEMEMETDIHSQLQE